MPRPPERVGGRTGGRTGGGTVLHVVQTWGSGGTERYVADLGRFLAADGRWTPELAVLRADPPDPAAAPGFAAVRGVPTVRAFRRLLASRRPDVVHLHLYTALLPAVLAARAAGVPAAAHLHIPLRDWNLRHRLGWRAAVRLADHVCGVARDVLASVGRADGDGRATLVPPPVAVPDPAPPRPPHDPDRPFTLVGVGRLAVQKDWPTLLRALPAVIGRVRRPVRFVHVGGGERADEFRTLVRDLNLAGVVDARGPRPHAETMDLVAAADLFVLPSRFEGLGIAPLEAMARGVPVLTADYPAAADYITDTPDGPTGFTFPRGDAPACAAHILRHAGSPDWSAAVGRRGRAFVAERFTPGRTFGRLPGIYAALRHGSGPA